MSSAPPSESRCSRILVSRCGRRRTFASRPSSFVGDLTARLFRWVVNTCTNRRPRSRWIPLSSCGGTPAFGSTVACDCPKTTEEHLRIVVIPKGRCPQPVSCSKRFEIGPIQNVEPLAADASRLVQDVRLERRAFAVPHVILGGTCGALVATSVVPVCQLQSSVQYRTLGKGRPGKPRASPGTGRTDTHYADDYGSSRDSVGILSADGSFRAFDGWLGISMKTSKRQLPGTQQRLQGVLISSDPENL